MAFAECHANVPKGDICIYIYRERERERERGGSHQNKILSKFNE
jgi:hypothetical protein